MSDTWFDPNFIKSYNHDVLPHIEKLEEGFFLKQERESQAMERFIARKKRDREINTARNRVRQQRGVHAAERGKAREMDIRTGQPVSGKNAGGFYESIESIIEDKLSGETRKENDKFRGLKDFRKDFALSTKMSLTGDKKEKDKFRKREERRLNEFLSIQSERKLNEQEEEGSDGQTETDQPEEKEATGTEQAENALSYPFEIVFEQLKAVRSKVRNVFENLSNISYKMLTDQFGVRSINVDDRDFQIENALILVSRICSGASQSEIEYSQQLQNGRLFDFNEEAFDVARNLLSQLGENCFQNLIHSDELQIMEDYLGAKRTQILCGNNTFKIVVGKVYIKESTDSPNYGVKNRFIINNLIPLSIPQNEQYDQISMFINPLKEQMAQISLMKFVDDENAIIESPEALKILKKNKLIDENGQLIEMFKLSGFKNLIKQYTTQILEDLKTFKKSMFVDNLKRQLVSIYLIGNNTIDPRANANLLLSDNGLFTLDENFIDSYKNKSELNFKLKKTFKSSSGRRQNGSAIPKSLEKNKTIVEQVKNKMNPPSIEDQIIIPGQILLENLDTLFYTDLLDMLEIEFSISLNPGNFVNPREKKKNEYNVVKIKGKEYKIPVKMDKGDMSTQTIKEEFETVFSLHEKRKLVMEKLKGYEKEYSKKTSHHRSNRNKARRAAEDKWGAAAIKGKDVDHKDGNPMNNSPSNLRLRSKGDNRSDNGHHKGETYEKARKGITSTFKGKKK